MVNPVKLRVNLGSLNTSAIFRRRFLILAVVGGLQGLAACASLTTSELQSISASSTAAKLDFNSLLEFAQRAKISYAEDVEIRSKYSS